MPPHLLSQEERQVRSQNLLDQVRSRLLRTYFPLEDLVSGEEDQYLETWSEGNNILLRSLRTLLPFFPTPSTRWPRPLRWPHPWIHRRSISQTNSLPSISWNCQLHQRPDRNHLPHRKWRPLLVTLRTRELPSNPWTNIRRRTRILPSQPTYLVPRTRNPV